MFSKSITNTTLIQVYANNIIFTLKIRLSLYKIAVNDLLLPFSYPNIKMYTLNIVSAIRKMSVNKIRDFIFENYYKQI